VGMEQRPLSGRRDAARDDRRGRRANLKVNSHLCPLSPEAEIECDNPFDFQPSGKPTSFPMLGSLNKSAATKRNMLSA
jgi:hypothetical protein